jgi:hypothetical protein
MALSATNIRAMKILHPTSLVNSTLSFFELMKYETDDLRNEKSLDKNFLVERFLELVKKTTKGKKIYFTKAQVKKDFEKFSTDLDEILLASNENENLTDIKWEKIIELCNLLRDIEKNNEKKVRWMIYHLFSKGKKNILLKELTGGLADFKILNMEKLVKKILAEEYKTGLDARFDKEQVIINHETNDLLVGHYLLDDLEEKSRRSPGELEEDMLQMLDEGSFSNQELAKILSVDEAMISRVISKLRNKNKIVLSSFGERGSRYYTTNCENCPFGKTIDSCKKDALSYIIGAVKDDFDIDLSTSDFDQIETNQALLNIKRIFMMARKESNTRLERNLNENLSKILSKVIEKSLEIKSPTTVTNIPQVKVNMKSIVRGLPSLYLMGLHEGAKTGTYLVNEILKKSMASVKEQDRIKILNHVNDETKKFKESLDIG